MKKTNRMRKGALVLALALCASALGTSSVSAANIYGMDYSGGEELSTENVQIDPELLNSLTPLITRSNINNVAIPQDSDFRTGYYKNANNNTCHEFYYYPIMVDSDKNPKSPAVGPNLSYTVSSDKYTASVHFENIVYEQLNSGSENFLVATADTSQMVAVGVHSTSRYVYVSAGVPVYTDDTCATRDSSIRTITKGEERIFAQVNVKLLDKESGEPFSSNGLYISVTDIDAAQSYKILNERDEFTAGKMYSKSASTLQPAIVETNREVTKGVSRGLTNMFVANDHYIYSEYTSDDMITTDEENDIFVKLSSETQAEGLDFVFGFAGSAGSGIEYYADFTQDSEPEQDDVSESVAVPNTGVSTGENSNATLIATSIVGVLVIALMAYVSPRVFHKRIDFKK